MTLLSELKRIDDMHDAGTITQAQHDKMSADAVKKYQPTSDKKTKKIMGIAIIALLLSLLAFSIGGTPSIYYNNTTCSNCSNFSDNTKVNKTGDIMSGNLDMGNKNLYNVNKIEGINNKSRIEFHDGADPRTIIFAEKSINDWSQFYSDWNYLLWWNYVSGAVKNEFSIQYGLRYLYEGTQRFFVNGTTAKINVPLNMSGNNITNCGNCFNYTQVIRGIVYGNGTIRQGTGFTVTRITTGQYTIFFNSSFSDLPYISLSSFGTVSQATSHIAISNAQTYNTTQFGVHSTNAGSTSFIDNQFEFIAMP